MYRYLKLIECLLKWINLTTFIDSVRIKWFINCCNRYCQDLRMLFGKYLNKQQKRFRLMRAFFKRFTSERVHHPRNEIVGLHRMLFSCNSVSGHILW